MANYNYYPIILFYVIFFITYCIAFSTNSSIKRYRAVSRMVRKDYNNFNNFRQNKVELKIYYESLCPASADFFWKQLQPTVEALGSHMKVIMVPYGNAETKKFRSSYRFSCQHGPKECYGNKLHACAIDIVRNNTHAVLYNSCLMKFSKNSEDSSIDFTTALNWCGYKYKVPIRRVWNCAHSRRGTNLLRHFGQETHKMEIKYVPYVLLDGSSAMQDQATAYLMATICQMLEYPPPVCEMYINRRRRNRIFAGP